MTIKKLTTLIFILIFNNISLLSQNKIISLNLEWNTKNKTCYPCDFDKIEQKVKSFKTSNLNIKGNYQFTYQIISTEFEEVNLPSFISSSNLPEYQIPEVNFGKSGIENFIQLKAYPLFNNNGIPNFLKKITIEVFYQAIPQKKSHTFAPESVLRTGKWHKIGVSSSGIHKIDKTFLESNGINTSGLNPNHINIYGNHIPELPIVNSVSRPDDLLKNSIFIHGDADNSFDNGDYILFYATGPLVVTNNPGTGFRAKKNKTDSLNYYYIHIDAGDAPKRLTNQPLSTNSITHTVNSFNEILLHEQDLKNLINSGTNWMGEEFDIELSKTIPINLTGLVTSENISLKTSVASKTKTGTSSFSIKVNGIERDNIANPTNNSPYDGGVIKVSQTNFTSTSNLLNFQIDFNRSAASSIGWLDYLEINYRRNTSLANGQFLLRDWASVGIGNTANFSISAANSSSFVWEVSSPSEARIINGNLSGSNLTFALNTDSLRSFAVFNSSNTLSPIYINEIENQNLHGLSQVDYIIITHQLFKPQAERLANLHRENGLSVHVVEIQKVYNEFSSGVADPIAIRWFTKMFYDRAAGNPTLQPKSLLLFGDGSYDPLNRMPNNSAFLPTYQSRDLNTDGQFISYISSFTSDDFFGMLDDTEAMNANDLIDIGIGRIPCQNIQEATDVVNKIEHYMRFGSTLYSSGDGIICGDNGFASTFGDWRTRNVLIADDEDNGKFVDDCEALSALIEANYKEMNTIKIYLDAFQQVSTSGGQRYPDVEEAINQNINQGALVFNYVGHGGETGLSLERIITIPMIESWRNVNKLPLFISATCEFSRFDDPIRTSAGEIMLITPYGGAVALLTTTRLVYVSTNSTLIKNLYQNIYSEINGVPLTMGEIIRLSKNLTAGDNNMRNFTLLGDPALILGKPRPNLVADFVNGVPINGSIDTLSALSKITITGHVEDYMGNALTNFNGIVYPTVFDKFKDMKTLGQDSDSPVINFQTQNNILYKGKATVKDGVFTFSFIVPKDINYNYGKGKISFYADNGLADKVGYDTTIVVGGINPNGLNDDIGPEVDLYMNDENFVNGGLTNNKPQFIAKIKDDSGINTSGNGIGHDITLIIDGNTANPIILNNFYEADLDTYQSGEVRYQFIDLKEGEHQATFKVWDVNNNSSETTLDFIVVKEEKVSIAHLLNYPNPFTTYTEFFFEHNQACNNLEAKIEIFTVSGKLVKTIFQNVQTIAFRTEGISWDGRDDFGDKLARGVYVYRLTIRTQDGEKAEKIEKLVIL